MNTNAIMNRVLVVGMVCAAGMGAGCNSDNGGWFSQNQRQRSDSMSRERRAEMDSQSRDWQANRDARDQGRGTGGAEGGSMQSSSNSTRRWQGDNSAYGSNASGQRGGAYYNDPTYPANPNYNQGSASGSNWNSNTSQQNYSNQQWNSNQDPSRTPSNAAGYQKNTQGYQPGDTNQKSLSYSNNTWQGPEGTTAGREGGNGNWNTDAGGYGPMVTTNDNVYRARMYSSPGTSDARAESGTWTGRGNNNTSMTDGNRIRNSDTSTGTMNDRSSVDRMNQDRTMVDRGSSDRLNAERTTMDRTMDDQLGKRTADGRTSTAMAGSFSSPEVRVLSAMRMINEEEVTVGRLAKERGTTAAVREYGAMLEREHADSNQKVTDTARKAGITLMDPAQTKAALVNEMPTGQQKTDAQRADCVAELRALNGTEFDRVFATKMVDGHARAIEMIEQSRGQVTNAEVRNLLDGTLPSLREHKSRAEKLMMAAR